MAQYATLKELTDAYNKGAITEAEYRIQKQSLGATLDRAQAKPIAPPKPTPAPAMERGTSSGSSFSSTKFDPATAEQAKTYIQSLGVDPTKGFDSTSFESALDKIEERANAREERIDRAELAAKLGHAFGLMIAGGALGRLGSNVGKLTGSKGLGEAISMGTTAEGAGAYTGEMLKAPTPDMEKQRDRAEASRAAQEKTVLAKQQVAYNSWRDRMDQALRMADISRVSTSSSQQESDRPVNKKTPEDLNAYYKQLLETPKSKNEPAQITEDRVKAFAAAGMTGEKAKFFAEDQGTSWWEGFDKATRAQYLKDAHANIDAKYPIGGTKAGEDDAAQAAAWIRANPKDPRVPAIKAKYNLQ